MKNNLYKVLLALIIFGLTACQAAPAGPTEIPAVEFFKNQPGNWISVRPPAGWVAKQAVSDITPSVIVTDDWEGYHKTNPKAVGIIIVILADKGSAKDVLQIAVKRFEGLLNRPTSKVILEQAGDQSYASVEYDGKSAEKDNVSAHYFFAVISTAVRSVLVFSSVETLEQDHVRPAFQSTTKAITLH
jgi:hypothetical protein